MTHKDKKIYQIELNVNRNFTYLTIRIASKRYKMVN